MVSNFFRTTGDMGSKLAPQVIASFSATLGGFALGTVLGWSSPATEKIKSLYDMGEEEASWIGSIPALGAAAVMFPMPFLMDSLGRKITMLVIAIPFIIGWIVLANSETFVMFMIGRFITGLCGGASCVIVPVYIGEVVQAQFRGAMGTCFQLFLVVGILFSYAAGNLFSLTMMNYICGLIPILFFVLMFFMPESPTYLVMKNKKDKIPATYSFLRGETYDYNAELNEIEKAVSAQEAAKEAGIWKKFKTKPCIKAMAMCCLLQIGQQLSGINSVIFYAQKIFDLANTSLSPEMCANILGLVQVFATLVSVFMIDRAGRKLMMVISLVIMAICLFVLSFYFKMTDGDSSSAEDYAWLPLTSVCLYLLGFSLGTGPIPWLMLGELFSNDVKGVASSMCAFLNWILAFLVTRFFSSIIDLLGTALTFATFGVICIVALFLIWLFVLETNNKTLDEIQTELQ